MLAVTISVENLAGGMGTAAFVAYLSSLCNLSYTATQYALLSSFMAQARTTLSAGGGFLAESMSWVGFLPADHGGRGPGPAAAALAAAPPPWYAAAATPELPAGTRRSAHDRHRLLDTLDAPAMLPARCRLCWRRRPCSARHRARRTLPAGDRAPAA